jgi:hypothetical protein
MSRAAIMPTLEVGKRGRVGCFLLMIVLIAPEDILEGDVRTSEAAIHSISSQRGPNLGGSRNHCSNDDTNLEPTYTIIEESGKRGKSTADSRGGGWLTTTTSYFAPLFPGSRVVIVQGHFGKTPTPRKCVPTLAQRFEFITT